jgi:hypothetical protein
MCARLFGAGVLVGLFGQGCRYTCAAKMLWPFFQNWQVHCHDWEQACFKRLHTFGQILVPGYNMDTIIAITLHLMRAVAQVWPQ